MEPPQSPQSSQSYREAAAKKLAAFYAAAADSDDEEDAASPSGRSRVNKYGGGGGKGTSSRASHAAAAYGGGAPDEEGELDFDITALITAELVREVSGEHDISTAVTVDLHNRKITTMRRGALHQCGRAVHGVPFQIWFAHRVPVYPYTLAASPSPCALAWPPVHHEQTVRERVARPTHSPHPPPPGLATCTLPTGTHEQTVSCVRERSAQALRCGNLRSLDLSFNTITTIEGLEPLSMLKELKLYNNDIVHLRGLKPATSLQALQLQVGPARYCPPRHRPPTRAWYPRFST